MNKKRELAPIVTLPRDGGLTIPLSFTQGRMWFVNQLDPGSPAYNVPLVVRMDGRLDRRALIRTLDEIVRRHESLRTKFVNVGGEPAQVVAPARIADTARVRLPLVDLRGVSAGVREAKAEALVSEEARRPFNLAAGSLLRCTLFRLADEAYILVVVIHHIVTDGWSLGIFLRELGTLYNSFTGGQPSPLPELKTQYADYAQWQRAWLQGERLEESLGYWRRQLAGAPPVLELPTDRPRPAVQSYKGKRQTLVVDEAVAEGLKQLSLREGATLFMTLLAAFKVLLYRYTGQSDVVVGTPVANRNRAEVEDIIGPFVNTLVMRTDLGAAPTFGELLRRVKQTVLGAYEHQEMPFEKLVEELAPERDTSRNPIFQVLCVLQNAPLRHMEFSGLKLDPRLTEHTISKFDLSLVASQRRGLLKVRLAYNSDLFDDGTVARMLSNFGTLLEGVAADPHRPISELPLLTEAEREQLLVGWNRTEREYTSNTCAHQLFAAQAGRTPDAVAVAFKEQELTYAELNRRANQTARYLRKLGVGPEVLVGICLERSVEMVVALLGVLKAGGAYLPLDPAYPKQRLEFMIEDSGASILLTREELREGLPAHARTVCLDLEREAVSRESAGKVDAAATSDNLAYVIYTSGSTGRPKGVLLEHEGLCNLAEAQVEMFQTGPGSRLLQFASLSFDASVSEIFVALTSGATLVLGPSDVLMAGPDLLELLRRQAVTTVTLPPTLLAALDPKELPALRTVMSAGEACTVDILSRWGAGRRFLNGYGPTEVTVAATTGIHTGQSETPDIGRPLQNKRAYILDERLQPAPVGVAGRLYISGVGLARGYHDRPDLTAEKFTPDPFGAQGGGRMYDSGDLVRYREGGKIEFVGRKDHQVKVGGHRIELGEIEATLAAHADVQAAVVVVREQADGDKALAGYVVWAEGRARSTAELRNDLRGKLPEYMVPSSFTVLDALPLLPNGKVDRKALPAPSGARPEMSREYAEPRTELEKMLARVWGSVLGVERVGIDDSFFELGGNSLRAAIVVNKLQQELGEVVYIVALFDAPTLGELAKYLEKHHASAVAASFGGAAGAQEATRAGLVGEAGLDEIRRIIPALPPLRAGAGAKNPQAAFILSPPRSGSTLLRVMLAGHPALFAPPELELLSFNTLADRKDALSGRYGFWLEGTIRALMEIKGCGADDAKAVMEECERRGLTTQEFYAQMQGWIGDRLLVDKTPAYALDPSVLARSEAYFENALYIHLVRHPHSMIRSFEDAKLEQLFFRYEHDFTRRELAELVWTLSQQNILAFLEGVPARRRHRVLFEELVRGPESVMRGVCDFLGVELRAEMLKPYEEKNRRMTDGIHPLSLMLGDVKFHNHSAIDADAADRWRRHAASPLGEVTWEIAEALGYAREEEGARAGGPAPKPARALTPIRVAEQAAPAGGFAGDVDNLSDEEVEALLSGILTVGQSI